MKVEVKDFQSIEQAALHVQGLTVIVGPSNRGKSALLRAIEGALFNRAGASGDGDLSGFVRVRPDGTTASNAIVRLVDAPTWDNCLTTITWTKGKANTYDVDGDAYSRVGSEAPAVVQDMGYRDVWVGDKARKAGERIRPQVGTQFEPLFLLTRPGSFLADVLGLLSRQAVVATAQDRCNSDLRSVKQQAGLRTSDLTVARERAAVVTLPPETPGVGGLPEAVTRVLSLATLLEARRRVTRALAPLPADEGVQLARQRIVTAERAAQAAALLARLPALRDLSTGPLRVVESAARYEEAHALAKVVAGARKVASLRGLLRPLPPHEEVFPAIGQAAEVLGKLDGLVHQRQAATDTVYQTEQAARELATEEEVLTADWHATLAAVGVCPVCEQPTAQTGPAVKKLSTRKKRT